MASKEDFFDSLYEDTAVDTAQINDTNVDTGSPNVQQTRAADVSTNQAVSAGPSVEMASTTKLSRAEISGSHLEIGQVGGKMAAHEKQQVEPSQVNHNGKKRAKEASKATSKPQIFQGLKFFFLPDDDIAQARKIRIQKAQKHGATWIKKWSPSNITHVIVDKGVQYKAVLKYLNIEQILGKIVVVNELYPGHCILYNHLVNHTQSQYLVPGYSSVNLLEEPELPGHKLRETDSADKGVSDTEANSRQNISKHKPPQREEPTLVGTDEAILSSTDTHTKDHLGDFVEEARRLGDIPLDEWNDENVESESDNGSEAEQEQQSKKRKLHTQQKSKQENYSCMRKQDGSEALRNPNQDTIEVLQMMYKYYEKMQDQWRAIAYRRAISALRLQSIKITSKEDALAIPFVGDRLAQKIEEIVWTGRLRRLDSTAMEPTDQALQTFLQVYGIGYKQARSFVAQGHRSLEDLKTKAKLSKNQMINIEHYDDFLARITREEVERHGSYMNEAVGRINPDIQVQIGGSYRRGSSSCGDIDFIVTGSNLPMSVLREQVVEQLIPSLFTLGYLRCELAATSSLTGSKWHGAACLPDVFPPVWRRVDILLVPHDEYGAALIYFTGNDIFNRSLRLLAGKKGMRLNQHGLWKDVTRGRGREKIPQGSLIGSKSEVAIFKALGVPWRPPQHRNC